MADVFHWRQRQAHARLRSEKAQSFRSICKTLPASISHHLLLLLLLETLRRIKWTLRDRTSEEAGKRETLVAERLISSS